MAVSAMFSDLGLGRHVGCLEVLLRLHLLLLSCLYLGASAVAAKIL
jgi:hypothetical protein